MIHSLLPDQPDSAAPAGPYLCRLADEHRDVYESCTGDADLTHEIRLMRTVLAALSSDITGNSRIISSVLTGLIRAVTLRERNTGGGSELEAALAEAAERVLGEEDAE